MNLPSHIRVIALEGPSLSGKSSLACRVRASGVMEVLPEYTDVARESPDPDQRTAANQVEAFRYFIAIEKHRVDAARGLASRLLLDRSVDTLLAHAFALDEVRGLDCYQLIRAELAQCAYLAPDLTLFLEVSAEELIARQSRALPRPQLLMHTEYNNAFRRYFREEQLVTKDCRFVNSEFAADLLLPGKDD